MSFSPHVWSQLKGLTAGPLMVALERDDWELDNTRGSIHTYIKKIGNQNHRVQVHFHGRNAGWGPSLLKKMLSEIGWTEQDMKQLGLIN